MRFGEVKLTKEKFYTTKKPITIWDINIYKIFISN